MTSDGIDPPEALGVEELTEEEQEETRRDLRFVVRGAVVLLVVGSLVAVVATQVGRFPDVNVRLRVGWLVVAAAGFVVLQLLAAWLWWRLMRELSVTLARPRALAIWNTSNLARYVPTSLLAVVVRIRMCRHAGVTAAMTSASIVYEIVLMLIGALCLGAWFIVRLPQLEQYDARWLVMAAPIAGVALLHPRPFRHIADHVLRRLGSEPLQRALSFRVVLAAVMAYAATFVIGGLATFAFARGLTSVSPGDLPEICGAFASGFVVSVFGFLLPGGLGAREAAFAAALSPVMAAPLAVAVAIGVRLLQMAVETLLALVSPPLARALER